jgi:DNA mismatch repair protein MutS2
MSRRGKQKNKTPELDLHGFSVSEAIERLEHWLSSAIMNKSEKVSIIHGLGTGKVKAAVHKRLGELSIVRNFRLNELNSGMTDVYL